MEIFNLGPYNPVKPMVDPVIKEVRFSEHPQPKG